MSGFVVWTRYEAPNGRVIRHAYGPYPTRSKALTLLKRMRRDEYRYYGCEAAEMHVVSLIGDEEFA